MLVMERFFSKVNPIIHNRNLIKDSIIVEEKAEACQLKKAGRLKENDTRIKAVRAKYVRDLRASRDSYESLSRNRYESIYIESIQERRLHGGGS